MNDIKDLNPLNLFKSPAVPQVEQPKTAPELTAPSGDSTMAQRQAQRQMQRRYARKGRAGTILSENSTLG